MADQEQRAGRKCKQYASCKAPVPALLWRGEGEAEGREGGGGGEAKKSGRERCAEKSLPRSLYARPRLTLALCWVFSVALCMIYNATVGEQRVRSNEYEGDGGGEPAARSHTHGGAPCRISFAAGTFPVLERTASVWLARSSASGHPSDACEHGKNERFAGVVYLLASSPIAHVFCIWCRRFSHKLKKSGLHCTATTSCCCARLARFLCALLLGFSLFLGFNSSASISAASAPPLSAADASLLGSLCACVRTRASGVVMIATSASFLSPFRTWEKANANAKKKGERCFDSSSFVLPSHFRRPLAKGQETLESANREPRHLLQCATASPGAARRQNKGLTRHRQGGREKENLDANAKGVYSPHQGQTTALHREYSPSKCRDTTE